jgi:hypothetical protein
VPWHALFYKPVRSKNSGQARLPDPEPFELATIHL